VAQALQRRHDDEDQQAGRQGLAALPPRRATRCRPGPPGVHGQGQPGGQPQPPQAAVQQVAGPEGVARGKAGGAAEQPGQRQVQAAGVPGQQQQQAGGEGQGGVAAGVGRHGPALQGRSLKRG